MRNANKHIRLTNEYFNAFTYDAMGNILSQQRHNRAGQKFDNLSYHYQKDANGNLERNRLYHVNDAVSASFDSTDIDDMGTFISAINQINTDNNYVYDKEGRLVKDKQEEIDTILWTVTGKVSEIKRSDTSHKKNLKFEYDAFGRRIAKHVYNNETAMLEKSTYYILDAQGNQLSIYEHQVDTINSATLFYLTERNIYGSSRLGVTKDTLNIFVPSVLPSYGWLGNRQYELNNHLGNVLTVINDVKYPISSDNNTVDAYEVGISNTFDYSPFGAPLDGRTMSKKMASTISNSSETAETPTTEEIYNNNFDNPVATSSPYSGTTTTLNAHLSNDSWTSSTGTFTNYASTGAGSGKSIAISSASADTAYITLKFDVENGYQLGIENYSFAHRSSTTGYTNYILTVNGTKIGSGSIYVASAGSTLQSTGLVSALNAISGQTGTVNVVLKLFGGAHGYNGTFRMDNFVLNGYTQKIENSGTNGGGFVVADGYRYGFNGVEKTKEIRNNNNHYTAEFGEYNPQIITRWNLDPKPNISTSPYAMFQNNPILYKDVYLDTPTVKQAALMANNSYSKYNPNNPEQKELKMLGWNRVDKIKTNIFGKSNQEVSLDDLGAITGYNMALYSRTLKGKTEWVLANAGTNDFIDVGSDVRNLIGTSNQFSFSVRFAKSLQNGMNGQEMTYVGHSLGGGLAAANSLATGNAAIIFNPAGVSLLTRITNNLPKDKRNGQIQSFVVGGEAVDRSQRFGGMRANGMTTYIHPILGKIDNGTAMYLRWTTDAITSVHYHKMSTVLQSLDKAGVK